MRARDAFFGRSWTFGCLVLLFLAHPVHHSAQRAAADPETFAQ